MTSSHGLLAGRRAASGRVPDFFIVGHPKSGTSAMYKMLRERSQIYMPYKEPSYFVPEIARPRSYSGGLEDYRALYAQAEPQQRVGEATTAYLWSGDAARRIAEVQPSARIIAILREPASFLRSLHLQFIKSNIETEPDLRRALELERAQARRPSAAAPLGAPAGTVVLGAPQLYRATASLSRGVRARAGAGPHLRGVPCRQRRHDAGGPAVPRCRRRRPGRADRGEPRRARSLATYVRADALDIQGARCRLGPVKQTIKAFTPQRLRHTAVKLASRSQLTSPRPPDQALMGELRRRFKDEVVAAGEYLDRDLLKLWGYDDVG